MTLYTCITSPIQSPCPVISLLPRAAQRQHIEWSGQVSELYLSGPHNNHNYAPLAMVTTTLHTGKPSGITIT